MKSFYYVQLPILVGIGFLILLGMVITDYIYRDTNKEKKKQRFIQHFESLNFSCFTLGLMAANMINAPSALEKEQVCKFCFR